MVSSYIHLNPVRAGMVQSDNEMSDYQWSSYPAYVDGTKREDWLCVQRVLGALGVNDDDRGRLWYQQYVNGRILEISNCEDGKRNDPQWDEVRVGWYLGDDGFRQGNGVSANIETKSGGREKEQQRGIAGGRCATMYALTPIVGIPESSVYCCFPE